VKNQVMNSGQVHGNPVLKIGGIVNDDFIANSPLGL